MRKQNILLILGLWVTILPYLGFPYSWKNIIFTLSGIAIIYYSYNLNKTPNQEHSKYVRKIEVQNFEEDRPDNESEKEIIDHEENMMSDMKKEKDAENFFRRIKVVEITDKEK